jgi:pyrroloquinoline-quinone synthase
VHYGCPPDAMRLVRAHSDIEGSHRTDAWTILLNHATDDVESQIVESCSEALTRWLSYRDSVAAQMGLRNEG